MPDYTLTLTAPQDTRARTALGRYHKLESAPGVPRLATQPELKTYLSRQLQGLVRSQERAVAEAALVDTPFTPT